MCGDGDPRLIDHLTAWLGAPPSTTGGVRVVGWAGRDRPGWDGKVHPVIGVVTPHGAVVSVPPSAAAAVASALQGMAAAELAACGGEVARAADRPGARVIDGVFRWSTAPADLPEAGTWVDAADPAVPAWLRPFGGEALVAFEDGSYVAGVGVKAHDPTGAELAVATEERARGRGLARRLVATAARRVVDERGVATYLHADANAASARVAEASGFPDRCWRIVAVLPSRPAAP